MKMTEKMMILTAAAIFGLAAGAQAQQVTATETVETKVTRQVTVANPTPPTVVVQPPVVVEEQENADFIMTIAGILNDHDFATFSAYCANRVDYFGHINATLDWIASDMASDRRFYAWTRSITNPNSYRYRIDNHGLIHESIQEETWAQEFRGKRHHAHCRFEMVREGARILSLNLTVLRG
jgi:hypothetical protein